MTWQPGPAVSVFAAGLFDGRVAVVTGGGTGLGREVAHAFAHLGGHPVVAGRTASRLDEVVRSIQEAGGDATAVPTNIREPDQVEALRDAVYGRFGRVDCLVNNAGGQFPALPSAITDNGWAPYLMRRGVTINAFAPGVFSSPGLAESELAAVGRSEEGFTDELVAEGTTVRLGTVDEMAAMVLYLCSPAGRYVCGSTIIADGASMQTNWVSLFGDDEM